MKHPLDLRIVMPETTGIGIPGNHEAVEIEGAALPSELPVCPGSEMLGYIKQEEPEPCVSR